MAKGIVTPELIEQLKAIVGENTYTPIKTNSNRIPMTK